MFVSTFSKTAGLIPVPPSTTRQTQESPQKTELGVVLISGGKGKGGVGGV